MDDTTLTSLEAALSASPDNITLRELIARAHFERGSFERALAAALGEAPELLIIRARALLGLDRHEEAKACYDRAAAANPTLEDAELRDRLHGAEREAASNTDDRPRLRIIDGLGATSDDGSVPRLDPEVHEATFADVGGLDDVKSLIRKRIILPFQKPSLFDRFRKRAGGGVLLYGPPGCGKTLLARATAGECQASFFNVAISDILSMWLGESETRLHALFEQARAKAPAVLFFDEVEALGGKRQHSHDSTTAKIVSQFLAEMDGFAQANQGVLILAATNVPWAVDGAFRRPGRFDRFVFIPPPDRAARKSILRIHLEGRPAESPLDFEHVAKKTPGFSGADLRALVDAAADAAIDESLEAGKEVPISNRHLKEALKSQKPTTMEWLATARNHARYANEGGLYDDVQVFLDEHAKGGA